MTATSDPLSHASAPSAQATPDRAWIPWFHISNSGCCAFSVGAPVTAWVQSVNPVSS